MKKLLTALCIIVSAALLAACGANGLNVSDLEKSPYNAADQSKEVTMELDDAEVATGTETLNVHFANSGDAEYTFGMEPHLDVEVNGVWYVVPTVEGAAWEEIAYVLPAGEGSDMEFPMKFFYGDLLAGHYRIVKPLYAQNGSTFAIAEFTIE